MIKVLATVSNPRQVLKGQSTLSKSQRLLTLLLNVTEVGYYVLEGPVLVAGPYRNYISIDEEYRRLEGIKYTLVPVSKAMLST